MCACDKCEHNIVWFDQDTSNDKTSSECEYHEPFYNSESAEKFCPMFEDYEEKYSKASCYTC